MFNIVLTIVRLQSMIAILLIFCKQAQLTDQSSPILRSNKFNNETQMLIKNEIIVQL